MRKFLAVVKHEYKKIVLKWSFLLVTLLFPVLSAAFAVVPALLFSIKSEPTRLAVVDETRRIAPRLRENLALETTASKEKRQSTDELIKDSTTTTPDEQMKRAAEQLGATFNFIEYDAAAKSLEQIKRELTGKITGKELDAYLIIPPDYDAADAKFEFFSRKAGDYVANSQLERAINGAVRSQRLANENISEDRLKDLSRNVDFTKTTISEKGDEKNTEGVLIASFVISMMLYITLMIYGQQILSAVVEEKETRIAEILFSSAKPFELMMGKLVGVGLAGLTQLAIWIISALVLVGVGLANLSAAGVNLSVPDITPLTVVYFFIFFLLGFFIYATIYALIGSMVTTVQEGGQFAMLPIMFLVAGFIISTTIVRDPNSSLAFWASIAPFIAPITMPVRILAETPPFWQIALSILLNGATIAFLVWLAARVYRVGMLMYGKRATIPEVWKWIRQN
ncbi:MAG: ABC transporter permease [Acidobacteriota bacterium]|nr:ABC transporter permease [Acidobacteriota bacterium]